MKKTIVFAALIASVAALPLAASAGTQSAPLSVTATVVNDCTITLPSPLNVTSAYDVLATSDAVNSVFGSVDCTTGSTPSINLGSFAAHSVSLPLTNGSYTLNSTLWNSIVTSGGEFEISDKIAAGQNVPAGGYSGDITVFVNF